MPGIEADLTDFGDVEGSIASRQVVDFLLDAFHEEAFSRPPVAENAYRQGWRQFVRCSDTGKRVDVSLDIEAIGGCTGHIGVEPRNEVLGTQVRAMCGSVGVHWQ